MWLSQQPHTCRLTGLGHLQRRYLKHQRTCRLKIETVPFSVVLKSNTIFQESGSQVDDIYADPQEAEVIQSLLDVVDEEAQNLLNQTNAARAACSPGQ